MDKLAKAKQIKGVHGQIDYLLRQGFGPIEIKDMGYSGTSIYRAAQRLHRSGVKVHGYDPRYRKERIMHKAHVVFDLVLIAVFVVLIVVILINTFH